MDNLSLSKWLKIRKDLYRQLAAEVRHRLGREDAELRLYRQEYEKELKRKWQEASKEELLRSILASKLVLMGDFHALQQSQKSHLRILKSLPRKTKLVLALECVQAVDQEHLDSYLQGKKSEKEFLQAVRWQEEWGFPWEHYRPLLRWAQKHKVPVFAINKKISQRNAKGLKRRDQFAAQQLRHILTAFPDSLCVTIYGDLHLAKKHLPAELLKLLGDGFSHKMLRLFQNAEDIYFQLLARELETSVDVVRLSKRDFCLMNVPPWVKWQNYLMYLEQTFDLGLDDDEEIVDYTDQVTRYVRIMAEELNLPISYDKLTVCTAQDPFLWQKLQEKIAGKDLPLFEKMIEEGKSFYICEAEIGYLARASVNHASSLAMQFVHAEVSARSRTPLHVPQDFLRQIWIESISYFGSKMINHRRKTDTIVDIKASLEAKNSVEMGKEALRLSIAQKMKELMAVSGRSWSRPAFTPKRKWSYMQSAALLGGILGEKLYAGYRKKMLSAKIIHSLLRKPVEGENFNLIYYEMLETIEALPLLFKSKKEKL